MAEEVEGHVAQMWPPRGSPLYMAKVPDKAESL